MGTKAAKRGKLHQVIGKVRRGGSLSGSGGISRDILLPFCLSNQRPDCARQYIKMHLRTARARYHHKIPPVRQSRPACSHNFPHTTPNGIADNRCAHGAAGGKSDAMRCEPIRRRDKNHQRVHQRSARSPHPLDISRMLQAESPLHIYSLKLAALRLPKITCSSN